LAGNDTGARKAAEYAWKQARDNGASAQVVAQLRAAYDAASAKEDAATGKNSIPPKR